MLKSFGKIIFDSNYILDKPSFLYIIVESGRGAVGLAHQLGVLGVVRSNRIAPTF